MPSPIQLNVTTAGGKERSKFFRQLPKEAAKQLAVTINDSARELRTELRSRAPRKTGALRKSIRVVRRASARRLRAIVQIGKFYALMIEYGARFMSAMPFIRPSQEARREPHRRAVKSAVNRAIHAIRI